MLEDYYIKRILVTQCWRIVTQLRKMKLYTEEQVKKALDFFITDEFNKGKIIETLAPIELPSDDDIDKNTPILIESDYKIGFMYGWEEGAKWVLEQIKHKVIH